MRFNTARTLFLIFILLNLHNIACSQQSQSERAKRWSFHFEELKIQTLQQRLSNEYQSSKLAFINVNLITMRDDQITDSGGGNAFMVPGFALHDELRIMNENGLTPFQTLKSATVNASLAMNRDKEFGTIEVGKRADLLILKSNPLQKISHLENIDAVILRGIYLSRKDLNQILAEIQKIYNPAADQRVIAIPSKDQIESFLKDFHSLQSRSFIFRDQDIEELQGLLKQEHNLSLTRMFYR